MPLLVAGPVRAASLPPLGTAATFGVLAASMVTNTGPTHVVGDVGLSPGTALTGFPPGTLTGLIHAGDAVALQAQQDVTTAYTNAAGQACNQDLTGQNLGGLTLTPGVYCFASSAQLTGQLTLDGQGDPNSVFIFQIGSTLTTASAASVLRINGVQACRIFWQVGSSATLGTTTNFSGNVMALASITLNTGAISNGGLYARTGAVTLDNDQIQSCAQPVAPTPTSTPPPPTTTALPPTASPTTIPLPPTATPTATALPPTATLTVIPVNTLVPPTPPPRPTPVPPTALPVDTPVPPTALPVDTPVNTPGPGITDTALPATQTAIVIGTATALATETVRPATQTAIVIGTATALATETVQPATTATVLVTPTVEAGITPTALATPTVVVGITPTPGGTVPTIPTIPRTGEPSDWSGLALVLVALLLGLGLAVRRAPARGTH